MNPITHPLQSLADNNNTQINIDSTQANDKVILILSKDALHLCIHELIKKRIVFEIKYEQHESRPTILSNSKDEISAEKAPEGSIRQSKNYEIIYLIHKKYIESNFMEIPPSEAEIALEYGIKLYTLKSLFKEIYGKGFYQLYLAKRMEFAAVLLRRGYNCNEVSTKIGYGATSAIKFNKMFQKHFGITSKAYQMQQTGRKTNKKA
jgi:AraC-like DNA-binding protein